jgi:iron-sulfur cluster assembly protein
MIRYQAMERMNPEHPMGIRLTDAAAARVRSFLERDGGAGLRFGVRRTGCSGWAYEVGIAEEAPADGHRFNDHGVDIFVDDRSLALVDGTCIDFVRQGLNQQFAFDNPNVKAECGCGESFTTDDIAPAATALPVHG